MLITVKDLAALAVPQLIEELSFEAILARRKDIFATVAKARGLDLGEFLMLESATETILLEEASYAELLLRSRINEMYRSNLLYFATGAALDHVAEQSGVTRLLGENDTDLRNRVRIRNRGSSSAGPDDWWRYHAMSADDRVEDVAVTRIQYPIPAPGTPRGKIILSILARTPDGVPPPDLIDIVEKAVNTTAVRGTTTEVVIRAAPSKLFNVFGRVWLLPDTNSAVFATLETTFRAIYTKTRALGFDITPSWVVAQLMQPGVQRVELASPLQIVPVAADEAPLIGSVSLILSGRDY